VRGVGVGGLAVGVQGGVHEGQPPPGLGLAGQVERVEGACQVVEGPALAVGVAGDDLGDVGELLGG
jgi:hypothetical protein